MNTIEFGRKLKELRESREESQKDLGEILDVGEKQIQRYEGGTVPPPHATLEILCKYYEYDFISLLYDFEGFKSDRNIIWAGEDSVEKTRVDQILERLIIEKDITAQKIEEKARLAEEYAQQMKKHYEDSKAEKAELFSALKETRNQISQVLEPMAISLKGIPSVLDLIVRNSNEHDNEILNALDRLEGNPSGTLKTKSIKHILENAQGPKKDKKASSGK